MTRISEVVKRVTYGFTSPMSHQDRGIPIITAKNIREGFIDFSTAHYAAEDEYDALTDKCKPVKGDILITKDGTIGRCAVVNSDSVICINQSVALIQVDNRRVLPEFFASSMQTARMQRTFRKMAKGNSIPHLQITELGRLQIPLPAIDCQQEFLAMKVAVDSTVTKFREHKALMDNTLASLQHKAFRGEL